MIVATEETGRLGIATRGHGASDSFLADAEANLAAMGIRAFVDKNSVSRE